MSALVTYEVAARSDEDAAANRAWRIEEDGTVRQRRNRAGAARPSGAPRYWYQDDYTEAPKGLDDAQLEALREWLGALDLPPETRREDEGTEDGAWYRVTLRTAEGERVVEVDSAHRREVDDLLAPVLEIMGGAG